ncbi:MAG TPA: NADH-quinone oxidoreductase subunit I [Pirellulaceae bacterium]|jgi:NADH-quinone oxidoreductase subunit I|nr:NADH-quinone oxidoreductase subunit I [Pirellulaceae bacterium]
MSDPKNADPKDEVRWVDEPALGFWESTFVPAIVQGLRTTIRHVVDRKPVTQQFPEQKPELPPNYRGVHRLNRDEQGRVKCVACFMCATACPAHCIAIEAAPAPWEDRDKYPATFVIDELKCIYCGMCEEACPCDAIELTSQFDISAISREQMLFDREKLLSIYDATANLPDDPVRTHRGALGPASELEVQPASPPTRPVGDPAKEAVVGPKPTPKEPAGANLVAPHLPIPGAPTYSDAASAPRRRKDG